MKKIITLCCVFFLADVSAQEMDSLMNVLEPERRNPIIATFKSPKLVLLQTNEVQKDQNLTLWIGHRFGDIGGQDGGIHTLFGLDASTDIHIGLDYGLTEDLTIGVGRSKYNETYNLQAKYALVRQLEEGMPLSLILFLQTAYITRKEYLPNEFPEETDRISHFLQVIAGRKFSRSISLMISPGYFIRSRVEAPGDKESFFVLGMGGRIKFTRSLSIVADYAIVNGFDRPGNLSRQYYNPLGIGLEIETGGHVFSLNFQNSSYIIANNFIPYTEESWTDGGVRFGFTITRNFYLGPREPRKSDSY